MSWDYIWVCDQKEEYVDPMRLPGCTSHNVGCLRAPTATVLAWLMTTRWEDDDVKALRNEGGLSGYIDVTADVALEMVSPVTADILAKATRVPPSNEHITRLTAALEQNEADAAAMLEALTLATPLLPDDVKASLEARAKDILRTDAKALGGESEHRRDILVRAQREDMMRRRIVELVVERDAARYAAVVLARVAPKLAPSPETITGAAAFAAHLGFSASDWALRVEACPKATEPPPSPPPGSVLSALAGPSGGLGEPISDATLKMSTALKARHLGLERAMGPKAKAPPKPRSKPPAKRSVAMGQAPRRATRRAGKR